MNKNILFALPLTVLMLLGGCTKSSEPAPINPAQDSESHLAEGTVHEIEVSYNQSSTFVKNNQSLYEIYFDKDIEDINTTISFFNRQIEAATGVALPTKTDSLNDVSIKDGYYIIFGNEKLCEKYNIAIPKEKMGINGYFVKSIGSSVIIIANTGYGYNLGGLAFLREVLGYDMLSYDCVVFEKSGEALPQMTITECPDIEFTTYHNYVTGDRKIGQGWCLNNIIPTHTYSNPTTLDGKTDLSTNFSATGSQWHNYFSYVPLSLYTNDDAYGCNDWFYMHPNGSAHSQLCLNAHGNAESRQRLVQRVADIIIKEAENYPNFNTVTFTQTDNNNWCTCPACEEVKVKYGANSANVVLFLNEVDDIVQQYLKDKAQAEGTSVREFDILFFAYLGTQKSPTTTGSNNECYCHDHVIPMIAPLNAIYTKSFYDESNEIDAKTFDDWAKISAHIDSWIYGTNFHNYLYPYDSFRTIVEDLRFLKNHNVKYNFYQGQGEHTNVTAFGALKTYLVAKASFNVNIDYNHYVNKFFKYYFSLANDDMREFFDTTINWVNYLSDEYSIVLPGGIYEEIGAEKYYWPTMLVRKLTDLISKSNNDILPLSILNETSYVDESGAKIVAIGGTLNDVMSKHILIESIFPRFVNCTLRSDDFGESELAAMRRQFAIDCADLGITNYKEGNANTIASLGW